MSDRIFKDHWGLNYKETSIWAYYRFTYNHCKKTPYKIKLSLNVESFAAAYKLIVNNSKKPVIAITGRLVVEEYAELLDDYEKSIILKRGEKKPGNSTLIELIWYLFRKCTWIIKFKDYNSILNNLKALDSSFNWGVYDTRVAIGDYYYNKFLKLILKNKVYYTNCLVPKIERYMGLHESIEIQHGVIHSNHPDYVDIPECIIKGKFLAWNTHWAKKLEQIGYGGGVSTFKKEKQLKPKINKYYITIFTTVDILFSSKIENNIITSKKVAIQRHPRDYFNYINCARQYEPIIEGGEFETRFAICSDSTIIVSLIETRTFFLYLKTEKENTSAITQNLLEKYDAKIGVDYKIIENPLEALSIINCRIYSLRGQEEL